MTMVFGTKASTLASLEGRIEHARVLPQISFTVGDWQLAEGDLCDVIGERPEWMEGLLIVRSSGQEEDSSERSLAGRFKSVANVDGDSALINAINVVVDSFGDDGPGNQVFIQPMLSGVLVGGVAFSCDINNGGNYCIVNYDDLSGSTNSVTEGTSNELKTYYHFKGSAFPKTGWISKVLSLLEELERTFNNDSLDIEFAVQKDGTLVLLQVRPLVMKCSSDFTGEDQKQLIYEIEARLNSLTQPHPYLLGQRSVFGVMPDWNPAEIIGIRPRPLALSLYKELVTDNIWAYQRDNYGYRNLRSFPLLVSFAGLPYIDVRVSFNSFIPRNLDEGLADRLVNHYIDSLIKNPNHHDKVEFEIIYSCYTLDLPQRLAELEGYGFTNEECQEISESLRKITNEIIHGVDGLWRKDIAKLDQLKIRQKEIGSSNLAPVEKIFWLIEDCKRYGTLPFAGLARAGFIAVKLLKSLVSVGVLSEEEYGRFMNSLNTVSSRMSFDLARLSREDFLQTYGFLRPGAYDILSPRYDEAPDQYFNWEEASGHCKNNNSSSEPFSLGLKTMNQLEALLREHDLEHDVLSFLNFIKEAIEGREYAKFVFTKSLSEVLVLMRQLGREQGISVEDLSYASIQIIKGLYSASDNIGEALNSSISAGKKGYLKTRILTLPPLITRSEDIWSFELPRNEPNYITQQHVKGRVVDKDWPRKDLHGNVLMIPNADPGYDWIFAHGIGGFITMYGGANSHMAIRAGELGIPAVIGAGESLYRQWAAAEFLEVDCANKQVHILR